MDHLFIFTLLGISLLAEKDTITKQRKITKMTLKTHLINNFKNHHVCLSPNLHKHMQSFSIFLWRLKMEGILESVNPLLWHCSTY